MSDVQLYLGDCLDVMATLADGCVDAVVTDPPYGLSFMGRHWDHGVPGVAYWEAALRVAKPGAMLLAFGGSRTYHRLTCAIEDAGWEIRDCLMWLYGSGFPKSMDISKAIDKAAGAEREVVGQYIRPDGTAPRTAAMGKPILYGKYKGIDGDPNITAPTTDAARQWQGWGTALKPAHEIILRAYKPFPDQTERDIIVGNLCQKEAQLWLLFHVSTVGHNSTLNQAELNEVLSIAQWSAEKLTSIQAALCDQMDMSQFALMVNTCLSIVTSWKSTLADLWQPMSMSTTSTASSLTIDLKTLSYLLSQTTLESIIQAELIAPGSRLNVLPAAKFLNAVEANIDSTRMLSALGNATYAERTKRLDATADPSPAWEPIIMAMKPLDGTFANNALVHGVAGINVDACRIEGNVPQTTQGASSRIYGNGNGLCPDGMQASNPHPQGRWPANLLLDEEAAAMLDEMTGTLASGKGAVKRASASGYNANSFGKESRPAGTPNVEYGDSGGASRFFYVAKASKSDRGEDNHHPTVKPLKLMQWLCRLVTRPGGVILDPFMGSGSTGKAAKLEGFGFVGIDKEAGYLAIAQRRIEAAQAQPSLFGAEP